jgi:hypothetical protein
MAYLLLMRHFCSSLLSRSITSSEYDRAVYQVAANRRWRCQSAIAVRIAHRLWFSYVRQL